MDQTKKLIVTSVVTIVILGSSLIAAYVCFHVLQSSANADLKEWKLGGAFAGFIFTSLTFTSISLQIYKTINAKEIPELKAKIEDYRKQLKENQIKLIKGAPCPPGYEIDVDEHHKLVFARPKIWRPQGGLLYQYLDKSIKDKFRTNFNVTYLDEQDIMEIMPDFKEDDESIESLYITQKNNDVKLLTEIYGDYVKEGISNEFVFIDEMKALKYNHSYSVTISPETVKRNICQIGVFVYVVKYRALYLFRFTDEQSAFLDSSEIFTHITNSIRFL